MFPAQRVQRRRGVSGFWVEMPISHPSPNSPPSVNRVDAFQYTAALSTSLFVAFSTYRVARALRMDVRAAVRGALLHDLYLYDSKDKSAHPV